MSTYTEALYLSYISKFIIKSSGKESTEVQITLNKGKERENSYQKLKRS